MLSAKDQSESGTIYSSYIRNIVFCSASSNQILVPFPSFPLKALTSKSPLSYRSKKEEATSLSTADINASRKPKMAQRFLSRREFDKLAAKAATSSAPNVEIIKWTRLDIGAVFRVLNIIDIPSHHEGDRTYVVLETEGRSTINVWATSIIIGELLKYDINKGNVFIMPMGTRISNSTGFSYFNFTIVVDVAE